LPGDLWRRIRGFRRIRFTRAGLLFSAGALAVGLAAINTGNNLLYLILGAMLGAIVVSGWLSERTIRGLEVHRHTPRAATVEAPLGLSYRVRNSSRRVPVVSVEIREHGLQKPAFVDLLEPDMSGTVRSEHHFQRRGVVPLSTITLSTTFPFGLFRKERDLEIPGEIVVLPRSDRPIRMPMIGGGRTRRVAALFHGGGGVRGEYRGLRAYRPGDDVRDIHWRSTARLGEPVVREYEQEAGETLWICLDLRHPPGEAAEDAVEVAASMAARAEGRGWRYGLATVTGRVSPGQGPGHVQQILESLARVRFSEDHGTVVPPEGDTRSVLVYPGMMAGSGGAASPGERGGSPGDRAEGAAGGTP
jgi:uncharacterized protein (DUF58 family)